MDKTKVGFIGLGDMGKPMAKNLLKNGFGLTICGHVSKEPVEELRALGAVVAGSPMEVAEASEVVISIVRTTPQTEDVVEGKGFWEGRGIWQGIKPGSVLIICSTNEPTYCQKLAAEGKERGIDVLDAPVSGGHGRSELGILTIMVGGDRKTFDRCLPIFEAMGKNIFYLGGPGTGQVVKLVNNYMMNITAFGTSEAIALGLKAGLDTKRMLEVIKVSSGNSDVVQRWEEKTSKEVEEGEEHEAGVTPRYYKTMSVAIKFAEDLGVKADLGKFVLQMDASCLFPTEPPN